MGILAGLFEKRKLDENTGWGLAKNLREQLYNWATPTGVVVTTDRALQITAVFAAVRILAESLASLPLIMYRRLDDGGKEREMDHPLYEVLHNQANPLMSSFQFRETMMGHVCLWGNAYAEIESDGAGRIRALYPLRPDRVDARVVDGKLWYRVELPGRFEGEQIVLPQEKIFHVRGLGSDGITGYSPIRMARNALGLAAATEEFGSQFFGNGAKPGGVLEHPGLLGDDAYRRLRTSWEEMHQGLDNAHRIAILEEGMKYSQIGIPPEDAQFLETRKFQVTEIARIFRIPPHMLADLDRATFGNIEQQSLEFVIYTLRPWLVRWEQEIYRSLLTESERKTFFAEFLVDGLLRGDTQSRYDAYAKGKQNGWLSTNDIRRMENLNPVEGGDVYWVPLNMTEGRSVGMPEKRLAVERSREERFQRSMGTRRRVMLSYRRVIEEAAGRIIRREAHDVLAGAKRIFKSRSYSDFEKWLDEFFEEHQIFILRALQETFFGFASLIAQEAADEVAFKDLSEERLAGFVRRYLEAYASRHIYDSRERIGRVLEKANIEQGDPVAGLEAEFEEWEANRPGIIGKAESVRMNGAVSQFVYAAAGTMFLVWQTFNDSCPYCRSLNGKRVGINDVFLAMGEELMPEGAESALRVGHDVGHPPAHQGCDCMIGAGF